MTALNRCQMTAIRSLAVLHDEDAFGIQLRTRMQVMVQMVVTLTIGETLKLLLIDLTIDFSEFLAKACCRTIQVIIIVYL